VINLPGLNLNHSYKLFDHVWPKLWDLPHTGKTASDLVDFGHMTCIVNFSHSVSTGIFAHSGQLFRRSYRTVFIALAFTLCLVYCQCYNFLNRTCLFIFKQYHDIIFVTLFVMRSHCGRCIFAVFHIWVAARCALNAWPSGGFLCVIFFGRAAAPCQSCRAPSGEDHTKGGGYWGAYPGIYLCLFRVHSGVYLGI